MMASASNGMGSQARRTSLQGLNSCELELCSLSDGSAAYVIEKPLHPFIDYGSISTRKNGLIGLKGRRWFGWADSLEILPNVVSLHNSVFFETCRNLVYQLVELTVRKALVAADKSLSIRPLPDGGFQRLHDVFGPANCFILSPTPSPESSQILGRRRRRAWRDHDVRPVLPSREGASRRAARLCNRPGGLAICRCRSR